jgi:hypothetical protein
MTKPKITRKNLGISTQRLAELRRTTLIASTGSSLRLSGSRLSDKEVVQVVNIVFGRTQEHRIRQDLLYRFALNHVQFYQRD